MSARYIAKPLRLFDYCLVNDGAVCYILTSADRAKDLKQPPVYVGGFGMRTSIREEYASEDFWEARLRHDEERRHGTAGPHDQGHRLRRDV